MIEVQFLGGVGGVTGSRFLVETDEARLLVDCGLFQERSRLALNWEPLDLETGSLDAVLLTHAHIDHCGYLPRLVKNGYRGKIIATPQTAAIAQIALVDAGHLQESDAAYKRKRHQREGRTGPHGDLPLYTAREARAVKLLYAPLGFGKLKRVAPRVRALFHPAGHILGSAIIELIISEKGREPVRLVFSGDLGSPGRPILKDPHPVPRADFLFVESTYGDRHHPKGMDVTQELERVINETRRRGGNLLIPAFSIGRTQDILYEISDLMRDKKIPPLVCFVDSPMANAVSGVFERSAHLFDQEASDRLSKGDRFLDFPMLKEVASVQESKAINAIRGTSIILAGSGMCTGGRIKHHLRNNIGRPESTLLFVGYQARGTLGRLLLDGLKRVRLFGEEMDVRIQIERIDGFSAHADQADLLNWMGGLISPPETVFIVHGEPEASSALKDCIKDRFGWKAVVPQLGERHLLRAN